MRIHFYSSQIRRKKKCLSTSKCGKQKHIFKNLNILFVAQTIDVRAVIVDQHEEKRVVVYVLKMVFGYVTITKI